MSANQPRKPAGAPTGGQWAPAAHAEPEDVQLSGPAQAVSARRRARWAELDAERRYSDSLEDPRQFERGPDGALDVLGPEPKRYVLVEESKYDRRYWLSSFGTRADAASYHDTSEESGSWNVETLIDLDTGREFYAEQTTRFVAKPTPVTD